MKTKQTIAIIGATGSMGSVISRSLAKGNYRLLLKSSKKQELDSLIKEVTLETPHADVIGATCPVDATWEADIIILAVPYSAEKDVAEMIREVANQKIVISISNPVNENFDGMLTEAGTSAAEELQKLLPNSKVVKAFNTTFAADFNTPVIDGKQVDAFLAGNDNDAVLTVSELVSVSGFNPIHTGELSISRTMEAMQLLLIRLGMKYNYNWVAGWKVLHN